MGVASRGPSLWRLAVWSVAGVCLLLLLATSDSLSYVQNRMLLSAPVPPSRGGAAAAADSTQPLVGRVGGSLVQLPASAANSTAYLAASQRCRPAPEGSPPLPELKRAGAWEGAQPARGGNTTVVTTLHVDRWGGRAACLYACRNCFHAVHGSIELPALSCGILPCQRAGACSRHSSLSPPS